MEKCDYIKISKGKRNSSMHCVSGKRTHNCIRLWKICLANLYIYFINYEKLLHIFISFVFSFYHCPQAGYSQMRILKLLIRNTLIVFILFAIVQIYILFIVFSLFLYFHQPHKNIACFSVYRIYFCHTKTITFYKLLFNHYWLILKVNVYFFCVPGFEYCLLFLR